MKKGRAVLTSNIEATMSRIKGFDKCTVCMYCLVQIGDLTFRGHTDQTVLWLFERTKVLSSAD